VRHQLRKWECSVEDRRLSGLSSKVLSASGTAGTPQLSGGQNITEECTGVGRDQTLKYEGANFVMRREEGEGGGRKGYRPKAKIANFSRVSEGMRPRPRRSH